MPVGGSRDPLSYGAVYIWSRKACNSEGLAQAVADFWNSLEDSESLELAGRELAPCAVREWFRMMGYRWVYLKETVYKDGHGRPDVVAYGQDIFLPRLAELNKTFVRWTYSGPETESRCSSTPILVIFLLVPVLEFPSSLANVASMQKTVSNGLGQGGFHPFL